MYLKRKKCRRLSQQDLAMSSWWEAGRKKETSGMNPDFVVHTTIRILVTFSEMGNAEQDLV